MNSAFSSLRVFSRRASSLRRCTCSKQLQRRLPDRFLKVAFSASSTAQSAEPLPAPSNDGEPKQYSEKITSIVDQISSLTLLEVADLNQLLKERLNIQDAPVMAVGAVSAPQAAPVEEEEEEVIATIPQKTSFAVKLTGFDAAQKVKLIKEVKSLNTGMNLVQAKKFVESLPQVIKGDIGQDEADKLKAQLEAVGGTCEIE